MCIAKCVTEFERLYNKARFYDTVLPDGILAYKILNNASTSDSNEKLIRAILPGLTYKTMKIWLIKLFGDLSLSVGSNKSKTSYVKLKPYKELAYEASCNETKEDVHYGQYTNKNSKKEIFYIEKENLTVRQK